MKGAGIDAGGSAVRGREPRMAHALIPVAALIVFIGGNIFLFGGDPQIPLILAAVVAGLVGVYLGRPWSVIEGGMIEGITIGMKAILILMVIGIVIATWIAGGVVPILIYYGLQLLHPSVFLAAACAICCVVSVATGSSWTTAGTVGIALIGVGKGLGVPLPMVAGAIVSGSYFGDKMSPLSDSTNLAPAVAGSELFEHIRHMVYTTGPALVLSLLLYGFLGLRGFSGQTSSEDIERIVSVLNKAFDLNPILFAPPLLIIGMVVFRLPALPALVGAALLGAMLAVGFQGSSLGEIMKVAHYGYHAETGNQTVDALLSRGGLDSMMFTVSLILCALTFGGIMERCGFLRTIAEGVLIVAKSTGSLIAATVGTCIVMNVIAPDQYLSIIVPGRMYREAYKRQGLHPKNLSRTLEDAGTLSSPLVAWNTCGVFMSTTLTVSSLAYAPYAFFNLLCPLVAVIFGFIGYSIVPADEASQTVNRKPAAVEKI